MRKTGWVLWATIACRSPEAEPEPEPLICEPGPIRLLDVLIGDVSDWDVYTVHAGQHIVASFSALTPKPTRYISSTHVIDVCGVSPLELIARTDEGADEAIGAAGPWVLGASYETHTIRWMDPAGKAPSHVVFDTAGSCLLEIADGLAALDAEGTLWFHPDPADPEVEPIELAHDAAIPDSTNLSDDLTCRARVDVPIAEGDGLLLLEREGPLVRIAVPGGEREIVIDATVADVAVLDDPRYLVWVEGIDDAPDCCELRLRDRLQGDDIALGSGRSVSLASRAGHWVSVRMTDPVTMTTTTMFVDAETGATRTIEDDWELIAQLSTTRLLVQPAFGVSPPPHILDAANGSLEPLDFPEPSRFDPKYADGVLGFEPDGSWDRGTLKLLRREPFAIETLAYVHTPYARLQDGTIVFVERALDDDPSGTLVVLRNGERQEVATDVRVAWVPFLGTDRELREVVYTALGPEGPALWRYPLP